MRGGWLLGGIALAALAAPTVTQAVDLRPSAVFLQAGTARDTHVATLGLAWDAPGRWTLGSGSLTWGWEASLSRWSYPGPAGQESAWLAQAGIKPVMRWVPRDGISPWFAEAGIGLSVTTRRYETRGKRFSTTFNFGDHVALGRSFGPARQDEVSIRVEHFSNAGIDHPNPGENFLQLRWSRRF